MTRLARSLALSLAVVGSLALPVSAWAAHEDDPRTANLRPLGHVFEPRVLGGAVFDPVRQPDGDIHTDIAFWGNHAFQGNWDGFTIRDVSDVNNPRTVSRTFCDGNQGDIVVWGDILVRTWNTAAGTPGPFGAGLRCDSEVDNVPAGFEGLHVFDISDLEDPELVASVPLPCGSHTATGVPDTANDRLLIYNNGSGGDCQGIEIVEVPLGNPAGASFLRSEPAGRACHDTGVILGDAMRAACAGGDGFTVWSLGGEAGGTLEDPEMLYSRAVPTVSVGHSAAFTYDGDTLIFGHEPGGGVAAECEATDAAEKKTYFFFDTDSGTEVGRWTLPRAQGATENCSLHNPAAVPIRSGRDVLVAGAYQAGTWIVDLSKPAKAKTVAWSDPPPKPVPPATPFCCDVTGSWSSHWYNGAIYESNIGEGLNIWSTRAKAIGAARRLDHLNPQTQEFTID